MYTNRSRNILAGIVLVIIIILIIIFLIRNRENPKIVVNNSPLPFPSATSSYEGQLQNNFGITVPSTAIKADLRDGSGGNQMGLVTLDKENEQNVYTVLANLEEPVSGYFYEGWLVRGAVADTNYDA